MKHTVTTVETPPPGKPDTVIDCSGLVLKRPLPTQSVGATLAILLNVTPPSVETSSAVAADVEPVVVADTVIVAVQLLAHGGTSPSSVAWAVSTVPLPASGRRHG
jgi:hypothetical protein